MIDAAAKVRFVSEQVRLPDGRMVGDALGSGTDSWILDEILTPAFAIGDDGLPRFALVYLELARGHFKTGGAAAIALAEAVLEPGTEVVVAAGDVDQAGIVLSHLDGYLERSPQLASLFHAKGNSRVAEGGSRIRVISSDSASAWGHGGTARRFRIICDELSVWQSEELWSALASSTGKVKDTQTIILSNAGFNPERAWQWRVRRAAETEPWGHLYAPEGVIASWISPGWVEQQRALLPPSAFERAIMNRWISGDGDFVQEAQWRACVNPWLSRRGTGEASQHFAGLDLGLVKDRTALAVMHRDGDQAILDSLDVWEGTRSAPVSITSIERAIVDAHQRFPGMRISADPWQLRGSIERLRRDRVRIDAFNFSAASVQRLSTALFHAITSATLQVYEDTDLEREILGLRVVETSSGWRFDHHANGFSDRAVAVAMALELALRRPVAMEAKILDPNSVRQQAPHGQLGRGRVGRDLGIDDLDRTLDLAGVPTWDSVAARDELDRLTRARK